MNLGSSPIISFFFYLKKSLVRASALFSYWPSFFSTGRIFFFQKPPLRRQGSIISFRFNLPAHVDGLEHEVSYDFPCSFAHFLLSLPTTFEYCSIKQSAVTLRLLVLILFTRTSTRTLVFSPWSWNFSPLSIPLSICLDLPHLIRQGSGVVFPFPDGSLYPLRALTLMLHVLRPSLP